MALLREMYAVIGHGDVPVPGVSKANTQPPGRVSTALIKRAGAIDELLVQYPLSQRHGRRCDQQELVPKQINSREEALQLPNSVFGTASLEQVVGSQHDDQQICVLRESWGGLRNLPAILPHIANRPAGFLSQNIHSAAVRIMAPAQPGAGIVAIGVGVAKTDDFHTAPPQMST